MYIIKTKLSSFNWHFVLRFFSCGLLLWMLSLYLDFNPKGKMVAIRQRNHTNLRESLPKNTKKPLLILLVASSGRSGSTLMMELLGTSGNSVVFFEPLYTIRKDSCAKNSTCVLKFLTGIAHCNYSDDFERRFRKNGHFYSYYRNYHEDAKRCSKRLKTDEPCKSLDDRSLCKKAQVRIIKVIRVRLYWVEQLADIKTLNVRIIHLCRDPRGSYLSITKKFRQKFRVTSHCSELQSDLKAFQRMVRLHPAQLIQLQLETVCLNMSVTLCKLFQFLYGNATIPSKTEQFIKTHMNTSHFSSHSPLLDTVNNSTREYQAWRWEIEEDLLIRIEREPSCLSSIKMLGHRIFGSIENAQNGNLSL